jgi:hypothetical protein
MIVSIVFILIAALFDAMRDTIQHHFKKSIFNCKNQKWNDFFNMEVSNKKDFIPYTKYRFDGFHVSKSLSIIFLVLAIVGFNLLLVILFGCLWILSFNLFYNDIFLHQKKQ